jgi:uncharacterized protein YigE (DUF2233 family)
MKKMLFIFTILVTVFISCGAYDKRASPDDRFLIYIADPAKQDLKLYWKDEAGNIFGNAANLSKWLEGNNKQLVFAMNAGMYNAGQSPVGLYIENGTTLNQLDTLQGTGNFYMQPNGVFYLTNNNTASICTTNEFKLKQGVRYATQSGPMLLINGNINTAFKKGSENLFIRNGAGILPGNKVVFVMSKEPVNFYDMAVCFKQLGCTNALYLDGYVSRTYLPEKGWRQDDGELGVLIGITADKK